MTKLFLSVLNMSLVASYVILFVLIVRLLLKKSPKIISYALWSVVLFRLLVPFSFKSAFSLLPKRASEEIIPQSIVLNLPVKEETDQIEATDFPILTYNTEPITEKKLPTENLNDAHNYITAGTLVWLVGIFIMLLHSILSTIKLRRRLKGSTLYENNIYLSNNISTPFVFGFLSPRIYIPASIERDKLKYILMHEKTHIKRGDHVVKLIAFITLAVHWFNPLVWLSFILMSNDMETSCDEYVLKKLGNGIKKSYASSLLSMCTGRIINGSPLAFSENNVKSRIKKVLNYKKS